MYKNILNMNSLNLKLIDVKNVVHWRKSKTRYKALFRTMLMNFFFLKKLICLFERERERERREGQSERILKQTLC